MKYFWIVVIVHSLLSMSFFDSKLLDSEPKKVEIVDTSDKILIYTINYENKGSRSERRVGVLKYRGTVLPYIFTYIQLGNLAFTLKKRKPAFGDHGYQPAIKRQIKEVKHIFAEQKSGFYLSKHRYSDAPKGWAYVEWDTGAAFIDFEQLPKVLMSEPFQSLQPHI